MTRRQLLHRAAILGSASMLQPAFTFAAEPARKIKVGMISTAHSHAAGKLQALRRLPELYEVVGIVEPDEARRKALDGKADYAGLPRLTEEQLFNVQDLEAVLVETAVAEQAPTAARAAQAGVHIHLEKPAGPSHPAFRAVLDTLAKRKRFLQMGYMFRGNPAFQLCFQAAREGWLGKIHEVHGVIGKVAGQRERAEAAAFPGGMMFELGCHLIDALVATLGAPAKVQAHLRRNGADGLVDNTLAVFEYADALATIRSSASDVEGSARRQFIVCGDQGTLTILPLEPPTFTLTLAKYRPPYRKGAQVVPLRAMAGRYGDQLADFARIIRGEKALDYAPEHDLAVHDAVLRASGMPTA